MEDSNPGLSSHSFLYGTAWKEERTQAIVTLALAEGFRGIDTAISHLSRDGLFLQTKYTYVESQDQRLPYDPAADYPTDVTPSV